MMYDLATVVAQKPLKWIARQNLKKDGKLSQGLRMRAGKPWLSKKSAGRPLWFHASSGELEYARPILRLLKDAYPRTPTLLTYFSPSARAMIERVPQVQLAYPSPWDTKADVREFINFHQPQALLIARSDLWPHMLRECAQRKIPSLMFSTTATPQHARGMKGVWYRTWLPYLTEIWGVTPEDTQVLESMSLKGPRLRTRGDTRYDQVKDRLSGPIDPFWRRQSPEKPCIVLGSMWPEDEVVWIQVLPQLLEHFQVVWVPHEISTSHLERLQEHLRSLHVPHVLSKTRKKPAPEELLLVNETGALAFLYKSADVAFVGGSFKDKVHSVMEPLGAGCPVITGPFVQNNREALSFGQIPLGSAGLKMVQVVRDAKELASLLEKYLLLTDNDKKQILVEFEKRLGASQLVVEWLEQSVNLL